MLIKDVYGGLMDLLWKFWQAKVCVIWVGVLRGLKNSIIGILDKPSKVYYEDLWMAETGKVSRR